MLLPSAFTIAMPRGDRVTALSATVADGVTGARTNSNTELIGQGSPIWWFRFSGAFRSREP